MNKRLEKTLIEKYQYMFCNDTFCFSCDDGWYYLLDMAFLKIKKADSNKEFRINQIKEKFGALRLYGHSENEKVHKIIANAENTSSYICEVCGKDANLCVSSGFWYKSLCPICRKKLKYTLYVIQK